MRFFLAAFLLFALSSNASAQDRRVMFEVDRSVHNATPVAFDFIRRYGGNIQYFIVNVGTLTLPDGTSVDLDAVIREAIDEWNQALNGLNFQFSPAADQQSANLIITARDDDPAPEYVVVNGKVIRALNQGHTTNQQGPGATIVEFFRKDIANLVPQFRTVLTGGDDNVLRFLARLAAKHELGHALGFAHAGVENGDLVMDLALGDPTGTPVMRATPREFIRELTIQLERQPTADDVAIAAQEVRALARIQQWHQQPPNRPGNRLLCEPCASVFDLLFPM